MYSEGVIQGQLTKSKWKSAPCVIKRGCNGCNAFSFTFRIFSEESKFRGKAAGTEFALLSVDCATQGRNMWAVLSVLGDCITDMNLRIHSKSIIILNG